MVIKPIESRESQDLRGHKSKELKSRKVISNGCTSPSIQPCVVLEYRGGQGGGCITSHMVEVRTET